MKKFALTILFTLIFVVNTQAQKADIRISELINNEDWFGLIEEYPQLKDSVQYPFMKLVAEAMINRYTNHKEEAAADILELLKNHQKDLGGELMSFVFLRAQLLYETGHYAEAADLLGNTLTQLRAHGVSNGLKNWEYFYRWYNAARAYPPMSVTRPNKDTRIKFSLKHWYPLKQESWIKPSKSDSEHDDAVSITVPVKLHGKTLSFVFDTGGGGSFFVTEKFARENGLKILGDTLLVNKNANAKYAYIDSLQIGDITVHNAIATVGVGDNNRALDAVGLDAVLGIDIMSAVGETQINMTDSTMTFPIRMTPKPATGCNLLSNSRVKVRSGNETMTFLFDTGNTDANSCYLYGPYYKTHSEYVDANSITDSIFSGGYGRAEFKAAKVIPNYELNIDNQPIKFGKAFVYPDLYDVDGHCFGAITIGAVLQFKRTIFNYKDMFVKFENPISVTPSPDAKVRYLVRNSKWIELCKAYPLLRDSLQDSAIKGIADAILGYEFNHPQHAVNALYDLLQNYQQQLGDNVYNFIICLGKVLKQHGDYSRAASMMGNVAEALKGQANSISVFNKELQAIRYLSPLSVSRNEHDVEVNSDSQWALPVGIHGKNYKFTLQQHSEYSTISEDVAKELRLQILPDTFLHLGNQVRIAVIDSMQIGDIVVHNLLCDIPLAGNGQLVIGRDFMRAIGETQLDIDNHKIVFPKTFTTKPENAPNFSWDDDIVITPGHHRIAINYNDMFIKELGINGTNK